MGSPISFSDIFFRCLFQVAFSLMNNVYLVSRLVLVSFSALAVAMMTLMSFISPAMAQYKGPRDSKVEVETAERALSLIHI